MKTTRTPALVFGLTLSIFAYALVSTVEGDKGVVVQGQLSTVPILIAPAVMTGPDGAHSSDPMDMKEEVHPAAEEGSSSSDLPEKDCCICQYMGVAGCDAHRTEAACTKTACNDGVDNDGDGKKDYPADTGCTDPSDNDERPNRRNQNDCVWYDGKCMGWFKSGCLKWTGSEPQKSACEKTLILEDSEMITDHKEELQECTSMEFYRDGHGLGCPRFATRILACLHCATEECRTIGTTDIGCSTFNDINEVRLWMTIIQGALEPGQTLEVEANQAVSTDTCTSILKYEITKREIEETPDTCHTTNDRCYQVGESALCTDPVTGNVRRETCCQGLPRSGGYWQPVNDAASCPPRPPRTWGGNCRYFHSSGTCKDAQKHAHAEAVQCLNHNRQSCYDQGYNDYSFEDCTIRKSSSTLFSCTYEGECPWTCKYVEGR